MTLIDMANNFQQRELDLQSQETQMMTQFKNILSVIQTANSAQSDNKKDKPQSNQLRGKPKNPSQIPALSRSYCWLQGSCTHTVQTCRNKTTGHKDAAKFFDMLGVSIKCSGYLPDRLGRQLL